MPKRRREDEERDETLIEMDARLNSLMGMGFELRGGELVGGSEGARSEAGAFKATTMGRSGVAQATQRNWKNFTLNRDTTGAQRLVNIPAQSPTTAFPGVVRQAPLQPRRSSGPPPIGLVMYESPYIGDQLPTPSPSIAHSRTKSTVAANMDAQDRPALPSPALSDSQAPNAARPSSILSKTPAAASRGSLFAFSAGLGGVQAPTQSIVPSLMVQNAQVDSPRPQWAVSNTPTLLSNRSPTTQSGPAQENIPRQMSASSASRVISPVQQAPPVQPQSRAAVPNTNGGHCFVTQTAMRSMFDEFFNKAAPDLTETDWGRRDLLLEAIKQNDIFYIVLIQTFCLQSIMPQILPRELIGVSKEGWHALHRLLRSNKHCSPAALQFTATFPLHPQAMLTSPAGQTYNNYLSAVRDFLVQLPHKLDPLIEISKIRSAPPLTQDMAQSLLLTSSVLQTTVFRMTARLFWGASDNKGLKCLEELHKVDQQTWFAQRFLRTDAEKSVAYEAFANVFRNFQQWTSTGGSPDAFNVAGELRFFRETPPSMMQEEARRNAMQAARQQQMANQALMSSNQAMPMLDGSGYPRQRSAHRPLAPAPVTIQPAARMSGSPLVMAPPQQSGLLYPGQNDAPRSLPVRPDTARVALHQAHLLSPICGPAELPKGSQPLYRHVVSYAVTPTKIVPSMSSQMLSFELTETDIAKIAKTENAIAPGGLASRILQEGEHLYRLRCSEIPKGGFQTENAWVTADNTWPASMSCQLNDQWLGTRGKLHHGRHLPVDLSQMVRAGSNTLAVHLARATKDPGKFEYAIAIEVVTVSSHSDIIDGITPLSSAESLASIKQSLSGTSGTQASDDDLVLTSSTLSINLFDPFTADRIFTIPVRGNACLHRDCFDLETFLGQCQREKPGYPCVVDCWRCPICKADARPHSLVKDGFMVDVREKLERLGMLDTRAIVVEADGSWRAKIEERTGVRSPSMEVESTGATTQNRVVEIIELD
ncbi:hypothetical protein B0A48_12506 [Cryoendolithus antarcticus]|uniref:SP-RING-type domain-containing protein n=1 Tax=Cryoendolithus antarcticus TaxID=1507870 RepID=A0A1V8SS92_9PEZI|nr:hypothetical protein B0A48_12506 [Cryoendolithus antarcticus]